MSVSRLPPLEPEPEEPARVFRPPRARHEYAQHCSMIAADIAEFSRYDRDDEVQLYLREQLYKILRAAFRAIGIDWDDPGELYREDRGDGLTIVFEPHVPTGQLVTELPDPLLAGLRHHNKMSSQAARIQLRLALHAGLVTRDPNGFAGRDAVHLFRILEARPVKQHLAASGADLALIASKYVFDHFIGDAPGPVYADAYTHTKANVKNTHSDVWYRLAGGPPAHRAGTANGYAVRAAEQQNLRALAQPASGTGGSGGRTVDRG